MAFDASGLKKSSMQETENACEGLFSKSEIRGYMAFVAPKNLAYVSAFSVCKCHFSGARIWGRMSMDSKQIWRMSVACMDISSKNAA